MLTVNLFDGLFRQSVCSVAYQEPACIRYVRDVMDFDGITLFTDGYIGDPVVSRVKSRYKVGWLREPECLHPGTYWTALDNVYRFDFILTYYDPFLAMPGFRFCPYGGIWLDRAGWAIRPKSRLVSMLSGDKLATDGHRLRRRIAEAVDPERVDLYGYRGRPVDYSQATKLATLADYQFSIITETCRQDNLFTEWLLDCFVTGTVPVYWGCPNAGKFFNADGILSFSREEEAQEIIGDLSPELYRAMLPAVEDNFNRAGAYAVTEDWLYLNVLRELC